MGECHYVLRSTTKHVKVPKPFTGLEFLMDVPITDHICHTFRINVRNQDNQVIVSGAEVTGGRKYMPSMFEVQVLVSEAKEAEVEQYGSLNPPLNATFDVQLCPILDISGADVCFISVNLRSECPPKTEGKPGLKKLFDRRILTDYVIQTKSAEMLQYAELMAKHTLTDTLPSHLLKNFDCHKVVLAAESPYFCELLKSESGENSGVLNWTELYDEDVVECFLEFLYTNNLPPNIVEIELCFPLLKLACHCQVEELVRMCAFYLSHVIDIDVALEVLLLATRLNIVQLKVSALNFIVLNYYGVSQTPSWRDMETSTAKAILFDLFQVMSEKSTSI